MPTLKGACSIPNIVREGSVTPLKGLTACARSMLLTTLLTTKLSACECYETAAWQDQEGADTGKSEIQFCLGEQELTNILLLHNIVRGKKPHLQLVCRYSSANCSPGVPPVLRSIHVSFLDFGATDFGAGFGTDFGVARGAACGFCP